MFRWKQSRQAEPDLESLCKMNAALNTMLWTCLHACRHCNRASSSDPIMPVCHKMATGLQYTHNAHLHSPQIEEINSPVVRRREGKSLCFDISPGLLGNKDDFGFKQKLAWCSTNRHRTMLPWGVTGPMPQNWADTWFLTLRTPPFLTSRIIES